MSKAAIREALVGLEQRATMLAFAHAAELLRAPEPATLAPHDLLEVALHSDNLQLLQAERHLLRQRIAETKSALARGR